MEIVFNREEALQCDGECTKWYHCICVGMSSGQHEIFRDDYDRHNVLQWLCNSCKEQNKETTQSNSYNHLDALYVSCFARVCESFTAVVSELQRGPHIVL